MHAATKRSHPRAPLPTCSPTCGTSHKRRLRSRRGPPWGGRGGRRCPRSLGPAHPPSRPPPPAVLQQRLAMMRQFPSSSLLLVMIVGTIRVARALREAHVENKIAPPARVRVCGMARVCVCGWHACLFISLPTPSYFFFGFYFEAPQIAR